MSRRALAHLQAVDKKLGAHIARIGPFAMQRDGVADLYRALARAIIYQQLNGKAAATITARVEQLGANGFPTPRELLALPPDALRGAGVSGAKERALRDLAAHAARGALPTVEEAHTLADDVLVERLTAVRGIGPWTVEMLLMFRLGRDDVLPATDYGVRQGFALVYGLKELPSPREVLAHGERWRPWRSVASWYLWRVLERANAAKRATLVPTATRSAARRPTRGPSKKVAAKNAAAKKVAAKKVAAKKVAAKKAALTTRAAEKRAAKKRAAKKVAAKKRAPSDR